MKTHTIRTAGNKKDKIISFTKPFLDELLKSHPNAVALTIQKLKSDLTNITSLNYSIDYDQMLILNRELNQIVISDVTLSKINRVFEIGVLYSINTAVNDVLQYTNCFYNKLINVKD